MELKDAVVIVTGASQGIGEASAKALAGQGAKLALVARSLDLLNEVAKNIPGALVIQADMTKPEDIKMMIAKTVEHFGRIDLLVNNAGQATYGNVESVDPDNYHKIIELNIFGPLLAMQAVIPQMRKQGGGMILNVSSQVSKMYLPGLAAYASTKYALNALSLTARQELEKDKIVVSVLHPGLTSTNFGKNALGQRSQQWSGGNASGPDGQVRQMPQSDPPEKVAEKLIELAKSGEAELLVK
jgi:short-subunit dehydrogenase